MADTLKVSRIPSEDYEEICFFEDPSVQLRSYIAIHNTKRGPSLGGVRLYPYANPESALRDAKALARAMTYKAALADLPLGGGKAVIIGDPKVLRTQALFEAFGRCVEELKGRYITTVDSGTTPESMDWIRNTTSHVAGITPARGGRGDPSPNTALGVVEGIRACLKVVTGSDSIAGRRIAIQGIGNVGYRLAVRLHAAGAKLVVADASQDALKRATSELGAEVIDNRDIFGVACDVLAPCAMGGVITKETVETLKCSIVAGAANNQLADDEAGERLFQRGISYAPDFVINGGGLMYVYSEIHNESVPTAETRARKIYGVVESILLRSKTEKKSSSSMAVTMAQEIISRS